MNHIVIDIETRSVADLKKVGVYAYAEHETTSITHIGYRNGSGGVDVWRPAQRPIPNVLADALADETVELIAHNAGFERLVMSGLAGRQLGLPASLAAPERWNCTAARAAHVGLPRDLAGACLALRLPQQKDRAGHALMLRCCRPRSTEPLTWWDDDDRMSRMAAYCAQDVAAEVELDWVLPPLTLAERAVWLATERLNDRGVRCDQALLQRLVRISEAARRGLDAQMSELTNGAVPRVSNHAALTRWLSAQGLPVEGASRDIVQQLLEGTHECLKECDDLDPVVRAVLELRQDGGGSSAQKAKAISRQLSTDGRIRGGLIYGGAPATLRWSSVGAQMHNLPRHDPRFDPSLILRDLADDATLDELEDLHGPGLKLVSEMLRPLLIAAPGSILIAADFAQIEARVLAWLAGQEDRLDVFRAYDAGTGPDLYRVTASRIYGISSSSITTEQRQIGKVAELSLGFQAGIRALRSMARNFRLDIPAPQAEEIKHAWRAANPAIGRFWWALNEAACACLAQPPGPAFPVGRVQFRRNERAMTLRLPSGRHLVYWSPTLRETETPWGEKRLQPYYFGQDALTRQWMEFKGYGGIFCQNATQATARDLLADALVRLDAADLNPVLTIHDEVICETDAANARAVADILLTRPTWAPGLPIAVDTSTAVRYMKGAS